MPRLFQLLRRLIVPALCLLSLGLMIGGAAIAIAVHETPGERVSAFGQQAEVGGYASASLSGPGHLNLFGESFATVPRFRGLIRPTFTWEVAQTADSSTRYFESVASKRETLVERLADGWRNYYRNELQEALKLSVLIGLSPLVGLLLVSLPYGIPELRSERRFHRQLAFSGLAVCASIASTLVINYASIRFTATDMAALPHYITTPEQLVGADPLRVVAHGRPIAGGTIVVLGDSTAAGVGNAPLPHPTLEDQLCQRSDDSFAEDMARPQNWRVLNFACSGATIQTGLFQPEYRGAHRIQSQLAELKLVKNPAAIIISVGADDMDWQWMLHICAGGGCGTNFSNAFFRQNLGKFGARYAHLLIWLHRYVGSLDRQPPVLINLYYNPFGGGVNCLPSGVGSGDTTSEVEQSRLQIVGQLTALQEQFNELLVKGAESFHFIPVEENFGGHGLCSRLPYVQEIDKSAAPFHPNPIGELTIATADSQALRGLVAGAGSKVALG